jgi:hypothetical protein
MEMQRTHNTLSWLFERYLENPNGSWDITRSLHNECIDVQQIHELGQYLAEKGYVKHQEFLEDGFACTITTLGINQVSDEFSHVKFKILEASIERKTRSIMEILGIEPEHFKRVQDYATYLKRLGIIECIFHPNDVYAEPTFYGREWYEQNKLKFIN